MSADLFAEFGLNSSNTQSTSTSHQQTVNAQTSSLIPGLEAFDDDDGFGDFTGPVQTTQSTQQIGKLKQTPKYDDNVLFDATLETVSNAESDDWGDFESAEPSQQQPKPHAPSRITPSSDGHTPFGKPHPIHGNLDLLGSLSISDKKPPASTKRTSTPPRRNHQPQRGKAVAPPKLRGPSDADHFEEWGDFTDGPPSAPSRIRQRKPACKPTSNKLQHMRTENNASQPFSNISQEQIPASQVRPTNIPPPSVLLELFPQVLDKLRQEAMQARKNLQEKERVDTTASTALCTLKTAARVIAGRTLRWKRDAILSQSMRIGPARSGKPGGMKLSTVNRNEDVKEQQQAVDVLAIWRDRAALFSSVVQASGRRPVPVIAENIRAITASAAQGAIKASHACALCGLKRDERLPKVDEGVEDSFGEWWTVHWGHSDCKEFWGNNMKLLNQR